MCSSLLILCWKAVFRGIRAGKGRSSLVSGFSSVTLVFLPCCPQNWANKDKPHWLRDVEQPRCRRQRREAKIVWQSRDLEPLLAILMMPGHPGRRLCKSPFKGEGRDSAACTGGAGQDGPVNSQNESIDTASQNQAPWRGDIAGNQADGIATPGERGPWRNGWGEQRGGPQEGGHICGCSRTMGSRVQKLEKPSPYPKVRETNVTYTEAPEKGCT